MSRTHETLSHEHNEALDKKYHFEKAEKSHLADEKSIKKSIMRHGIKEIDRKWAPRLKASKDMASSLRSTLAKKMK